MTLLVAEFKDGAKYTDPAKIASALDVAVRGLATMQKYTTLDKRSSDWRVTLEEDPLGQHGADQRRAEKLHAERVAAKAEKSKPQG